MLNEGFYNVRVGWDWRLAYFDGFFWSISGSFDLVEHSEDIEYIGLEEKAPLEGA